MDEKRRLVGRRIRQIRIERNLSQHEVAEKLGMSQGQVSNMEKAQTTVSLSNLLKLAEVLECRVADFFTDIDGGSSGDEKKDKKISLADFDRIIIELS